MAKHRHNKALLEKVVKDIPPYLKVFISQDVLVCELLFLFWVTMQTGSTREEDVLRCVYKMITYGIKLASRGSPHIFTPEFDQLLTFGVTKPEISLSMTTRTLMEENYEFLKLKSTLMAESLVEGRQNYETVINQLKRNRRRNRQLQGGTVKYKFLEGTGTEIKYDIRMGYFFEQKRVL